MSQKNLVKIKSFYFLLGGVFIILFFLIGFTFKRISSAIRLATEIDKQISGTDLGINEEKLEKAYEAVFNKKIISLDLIE